MENKETDNYEKFFYGGLSPVGQENLLRTVMEDKTALGELFYAGMLASYGNLPEYRERAKSNISRLKGRVRRRRRFSVLGIAFSAAACLVGVFVLFFFLKGATETEYVVAEGGIPQEISLEDGSKIWMNAGSRLTVMLGRKERTAELSGEAFFNVSKDSRRPFVVETENFNVTVTGTEFNVCCYPDKELPFTVLKSGSVSLTDKDGKVLAVLSPGQRAVYEKSDGVFRIDSVPVGDIAVWRDGVIDFSGHHLDEILSELSRIYGVGIKYPSECSLSPTVSRGLFKRSEYIDDVLENLKFLYGFEYKYSPDGIVVIYKVKQ